MVFLRGDRWTARPLTRLTRHALLVLGVTGSILFLLYSLERAPFNTKLEPPSENVSQAVVTVKTRAEDVEWVQQLRPAFVPQASSGRVAQV